MSQSTLAYHWSQSEFLRAWEAGAFDHPVELIEGAIWPVVVGSWHGDAVGQLLALLPRTGGRVTRATLPTGGSRQENRFRFAMPSPPSPSMS